MTGKFVTGDRVVLSEFGKTIWGKLEERMGVELVATVLGREASHLEGAGARSAGLPDDTEVYQIRFDDFDYRLKDHPDNAHTGASRCFELAGPTDDEIEAAIRSIKGAT